MGVFAGELLLGFGVALVVFVAAIVGTLPSRATRRGRRAYRRFVVPIVVVYYALLIFTFVGYHVVKATTGSESELIWGTGAVLLVTGPYVALVIVIKSRDFALVDRRLCRGCGYDLRGTMSSRCPECGMERATAA